ncbi:conserved hypothetical protein [Ricinus communis]|uniref:Uncharacterized protein n=1 Tax=Ricinus communis TaxID=3988 RepID=B9S4M1_RICCO|nr:conserved hypothetical protein [Ricinus communis]
MYRDQCLKLRLAAISETLEEEEEEDHPTVQKPLHSNSNVPIIAGVPFAEPRKGKI